MEQKIMEVLRKMQEHLEENQLKILRDCLEMVLGGCQITETTAVSVPERSWVNDLEDFLVRKALEGKAPETITRYRYELQRLLSYIDKGVTDISAKDISGYLRAYKQIRKISNSTLRNVRAVFSSFFGWLRDRERIRRNPMVLVEDIKVEKIIKKPYSDEERERMLRECRTLRDKAMLEFLYSTAVRVSELSSLNRNDIRFSSKDLIVFG